MGNGADKVIDELNRLEIQIIGVTASDAFVRGQNFRGYTVRKLSDFEGDFIIAVCFAGFFMIWTALNMSLARNIRNKTFIKHTLCYIVLVLAFRLLKFVFKPFAYIGQVFKIFQTFGAKCG